MKNVEQVILSQFANSPVITTLIQNMNEHFRQDLNFDNFYNMIWNIETAQGYGLDVWGRIVGVQRELQISSVTYLGTTGPSGVSGTPYDAGPFYNDYQSYTNYSLADATFRTLILTKAMANLTDGSIPSINQILLNLFGANGQAWCTDGQNMTMTYTLEFTPTPVQLAIIAQSGVLPRPPGVAVSTVILGIYNDGGVVAVYPGTPGYPTSSAGLAPGALFSNGGTVCVVPGALPNPSAPAVYFNSTNAAALLALGGGNLPVIGGLQGSGKLWNNYGEVAIS